MSIIAYNQTTGSLPLDEISAPSGILPASGSGGVILTDFNKIFEIQADDQLRNYITASFVRLDVGTGLLTLSESLGIMDAATGSVFGNNFTNVGSGQGIFQNKNILNVNLRSITASGSVSVSSGSTEINISGSSINAIQHRSLRQLIHFIDDGPAVGFGSSAFMEITPSGSVFPTNVTWKTSSTGSKIVEEIITYNSNKTIATDQWKMYDPDGITVIEQITDSMVYQGVIELNRTRSISGSL